MTLTGWFLELLTNADLFISQMYQLYGVWIYAVFFTIFFLESGVFLTAPFLPGDSLLFVAGAACSTGPLNPWIMIASASLGATTGNFVGYGLGAWLGPKLFTKQSSKWFNPDNLEKAEVFFEHHGGISVALARFIPLIRSLIPIVAGASKMNFISFTGYTIFSAFLWTVIGTASGFWLGQVPFIKNNLSLIIIVSIAVVIVPSFLLYVVKKSHHSYEIYKARKINKKNEQLNKLNS